MKRHLFWIVELIIWLLILFLVAGIIMFSNYNKKLNTYQIFIPDVDGLINGSPVRIMGIQVGYVNQIDIVGDDVYVRFIITDKTVKIPAGSTLTVESSGLGGSKSIEIYPPEIRKPLSDKLLIVETPKRLHDSFGLLNNMFNELFVISYDVSHFMDKLANIHSNRFDGKKITLEDAATVLNFANGWLDGAIEKTNKLYDKLNGEKDEQRISKSH